jgi:hypothetical protein
MEAEDPQEVAAVHRPHGLLWVGLSKEVEAFRSTKC